MIINGSSAAYGKFWVPGNESNACLGVLLINNDGTVYLFAFLYNGQKYIRPFLKDGNTEKIDVIFGFLFAPVNNEAPYVALIDNAHLLYQDIPQEIKNKINVPFLDCIPYKVEKTLSKLKTCDINTNFIKAKFSIDGLINWFMLDKYINYNNNVDRFSIQFKKPRPLEIKLSDNISLIFNITFTYALCLEYKHEQKFNIDIDLISTKLLSYDNLLEIIFSIQLFFCFNSDRILDINGPIKLYDNIESFSHSAELITEGNWGDIAPITTQTVLDFIYIEDKFEIILRKWIDFIRETYPSIFNYLENRENSTKYITTKYSMAWQAIESLGKTLNNKKRCTAHHSIVRLAKNNKNESENDNLEYFYFPKFFPLISGKKWTSVVEILYNTRNMQTHILEEGKKTLPNDKLGAGVNVLELIYQVNVLGTLGFSDDEIYRFIKNNSYLNNKVNSIYEIINI